MPYTRYSNKKGIVKCTTLFGKWSGAKVADDALLRLFHAMLIVLHAFLVWKGDAVLTLQQQEMCLSTCLTLLGKQITRLLDILQVSVGAQLVCNHRHAN